MRYRYGIGNTVPYEFIRREQLTTVDAAIIKYRTGHADAQKVAFRYSAWSTPPLPCHVPTVPIYTDEARGQGALLRPFNLQDKLNYRRVPPRNIV